MILDQDSSSSSIASSTSVSTEQSHFGHRRVSVSTTQSTTPSSTASDDDSKLGKVQYFCGESASDNVLMSDSDSFKKVASEAADLCRSITHSLTSLYDDLPSWRQDNHFIRSGYRNETFSFWKCVESLSYLHNESVNIYSHLFGSLFFLGFLSVTLKVYLPKFPTTSAKDFVVFVIFFVGAVICLGISSTYHCLNCHSESVAKFGNRLDYLGIIFLIVGSFVPAIYYGLHSIPQYMPYFFALVCTFGGICAVLTLRQEFASSEWRSFRAGMFVIFGLSGIIPLTFGGAKLGFHELWHRTQLAYLLTEGALYIGGAAIYAARIPERFKPGHFDLIGSSHQIFHVCVLAAAVSHLIGIINAYNFVHAERFGI
ncbi:hemolysin-III related-domain-containing protein [Lipomyces arxii]|uniref:hemolysin-III related-domain-containing protein n=1 Tax=Lipomyces arxii TaxID=56418 RepID=UPI0034CED851